MAGTAVSTRDSVDLDDIQGLIARGYVQLPYASYVLLGIMDPRPARSVLGRWADQVTAASQVPAQTVLNIALTSAGVQALAGRDALAMGFSEPFATGMATEYRRRLLADVGANDPTTWQWGGPATEAIHVAALLFAGSGGKLAELQQDVIRSAEAAGMYMVKVLETAKNSDREHFGFRDGISQPVIAEFASQPREGDVVRIGEFVLGYVNEYDQRTPRPLLPPAADPQRILPADPEGSGAADLGRNGSYLVFRQLRQDVEKFENYLTKAATVGGHVDAAARELLAAKIVGRWRGSGAPLTTSPDYDDPNEAGANGFAYHELDAAGLRCPIGAHIRRANPRDSLPPNPGTADSKKVNRLHRLLRRGRTYGPEKTDSSGAERGLHFLCFNANIARQYEFVQHSWLNGPSFGGLVGSEDALTTPRAAGPARFAVPAIPVRRRYDGLPQFVQVRGGAYLFMPGIRALRYLSSDTTNR
jgi:Dyp-type peroxidase family